MWLTVAVYMRQLVLLVNGLGPVPISLLCAVPVGALVCSTPSPLAEWYLAWGICGVVPLAPSYPFLLLLCGLAVLR